MTPEELERLNAPLYIDVYCYDCKRLMALSNAIQFDGRYYCRRCMPDISLNGLKILTDLKIY